MARVDYASCPIAASSPANGPSRSKSPQATPSLGSRSVGSHLADTYGSVVRTSVQPHRISQLRLRRHQELEHGLCVVEGNLGGEVSADRPAQEADGVRLLEVLRTRWRVL